MHDSNHVAVLDFGSQYTQLIVRRVRELGYFAKLYAIEDFPNIGKPGAIILSGGPKSTSEVDAPDLDFEALPDLKRENWVTPDPGSTTPPAPAP